MAQRINRRTHHSAKTTSVPKYETALVILILILLVAAVLSSRAPSATVATTMEVVVRPGDTLWGLASEHPIRGLDTACTANEIARINNISSHMLSTGSTIHVPANESGGADYAMR